MKAKRILLMQAIVSGLLFLCCAQAAADLTVTPITWNIIGLDSNNVNVGPSNFPVGVRVHSDAAATVTVTFLFDDGKDKYTGDDFINLRSGTLDVVTLNFTGAGDKDAYFEVAVTRNASAYEKSRAYHITASNGSTTVSTPQTRYLYVERLISQSRNSVTDVQLSTDGSSYGSIPSGGSMTLEVGGTYWIKLFASTATNGYEQLESFINLPNAIFQVLSISTTYTADSSPNVPDPNPGLYADGCIWDNDPTTPNYRGCLSTGKCGGNIVTTYQVKILGVPTSPLSNPERLSTLVYDFSGSSYHYNSDYAVSARYASIVNAGIEKFFSPPSLNPNTTPAGTSTLTFTITNPGSSAITGVNFTDSLPTGMSIASGTVTYSGFTVNPSPASLSVGQTLLSFSGAEIAGNSSATIAVTVTTNATGTYNNISGNLFINSTIDTGDNAAATLVASDKPAGPSSCTPPSTLATWTMPTTGQGSGGPPPPYTTKASDVSTATASSQGGTTVQISTAEGYPAVNSWQITGGWNTIGTLPNAAATPYFQFLVDTSNYGGAAISFYVKIDPPGAWQSAGSENVIYVYSSTDGSTWNNVGNFQGDKGKWVFSGTLAATATGVSNTYFRINAKGAATSAATVYIDTVTITGCPRPSLPTLTKSFGTSSVPTGSSSTLTFTFTNPNSTSLTSVGFSDTLPTGLVVATPNGLTGPSCSTGGISGQTITAAAGGTSISMSGATLLADSNCSFSVDVKGAVAGNYTNVSGNITSSETGVNTTSTGFGTSSLKVIDPPVISKTFGTTNLITGNTTSLNFSITNPNSLNSLTGVAFTDTLPTGLDVTPATMSVCGGTNNLVLSDANPDTIVLSGTTLAAGSSCTFSVNVTGTVAGEKRNSTTVTSTNGGTGNTATAHLYVRDAIASLAFSKQVSNSSSGPWYSYLPVSIGSSVYYRFTVENTGELDLTGVAVSDPSLNPFTCTWRYIVVNAGPPITERLTAYDPQSPLTIPAYNPATPNTQKYIGYCVSDQTVTAASGVHTNTATVSTSNPLSASDSATYEGVNPTAVTMGSVELVVMDLFDFLSGIGIDQLDAAGLLDLLDAWDPGAGQYLSGAGRDGLLAALKDYLDPDGDGQVVVLRWETLEERGTIGFHAERRQGGQWTRINPRMLPGLIAAPLGAQYWLVDPWARPNGSHQYRLIEVEARGTTHEYGPFSLQVGSAVK